jgi:hypothetical protein
MLSSKIALIASITSLIALAGAAVGKADAATTRYAGPGSSLVSGQCTDQAAPCRIDYAASVSSGGDTLIALPGVHIFAPANSAYISLSGVTLKSLPGAPMATIKQTVQYANACNCPTISAYAGAVIDRIKIVNETPPGAGALGMSDTATVTNSVLEGKSGGAYTFHAAGTKGSFSNNVVRALDPGTTAFNMGSDAPLDIRQSTIWAPGTGLRIDAGSAAEQVAVHNSIIRGGTHDGYLYSPSNKAITLTLDHSSIDADDFASFGGNLTVSDGGGNQAEAPLLADPANGDFHQLAGSPTVNHGSVPFSGFDIDGNVFGADGTADIGAYEYVAPATSGGSGPAGLPGSGSNAGGSSTGTLTGAKLKLSARKKGKITAMITCPKTAVTSCSGNISLLQGKKTRTTGVKAIKPGKTIKIKIRAKKGKAIGSLMLSDGSGAAGIATARKTLR